MYTYKSYNIYIYMHIIYIYIYTYLNIFISIYIYMYLILFTYIYIYKYTYSVYIYRYIVVYIFIYIFTYIHRSRWWFPISCLFLPLHMGRFPSLQMCVNWYIIWTDTWKWFCYPLSICIKSDNWKKISTLWLWKIQGDDFVSQRMSGMSGMSKDGQLKMTLMIHA